jgi:hypothetical protein
MWERGHHGEEAANGSKTNRCRQKVGNYCKGRFFFGCNLLAIKQAGWVQAGQFFKVGFVFTCHARENRQKLDYRFGKCRVYEVFEALLLCTMFRNAQWYHRLLALLCFRFLHFLHALFPHRSCFPIFQVGSWTLKLTNYYMEEENQHKLY